jgi:uncharacterized RDD family membrane protein YckC
MQDDRASFGARALATLLDTVILAAFAVVAGLVSSLAGASEQAVFWVIVGALMLASALYGPLLLVRAGEHNGQTLGKQVTKVRSVRADGQAMDLRTATIRELVGKTVLGSIVPFYTIIDYLFPLADARRQAIHDKLARTFVVTADAVPDFDRIAPGGETDAFGRSSGPRVDRTSELPGGFRPPEPGRRD